MHKYVLGLRTTCVQTAVNLCVKIQEACRVFMAAYNYPHLSDLSAPIMPSVIHTSTGYSTPVQSLVFPTVHIAYKETKIYKSKHINTYLSGEHP